MNSLIWKIGLFQKSGDNKSATCLECKKELKLSDGSTKVLKVHLLSEVHAKSDYAKNYLEIEENWKGKKESGTAKQPTLSQFHLGSSGRLNNFDLTKNILF